MAAWLRGLERRPVTAEVGSSNLLAVAIRVPPPAPSSDTGRAGGEAGTMRRSSRGPGPRPFKSGDAGSNPARRANFIHP